MQTRTADSVASYLDTVFELFNMWAPTPQRRKEVDLWFRGINDSTCALIPGSLWRSGYDEAGAAAEFQTRAAALLAREPRDGWEWYFLMQHYAMGTRLLDWSESPLVALHFALKGDPVARPGCRPGSRCVWVLDPRSLNQVTSREYELISPGGEFSANWLPESVAKSPATGKTFEYAGEWFDNRYPLAILPRRREPRILAQHGVFTVHGTATEPIDVIVRRELPLNEQHIARIDLDLANLGRFRQDFDALGMRDSTLFPEPEPLAREIVARFTDLTHTTTTEDTDMAKGKSGRKTTVKRAATAAKKSSASTSGRKTGRKTKK
jgi:hypothetical protein